MYKFLLNNKRNIKMLENIWAYITTFYNFIRISYYDWLDLSGVKETRDPTLKWVYYTHLGKKYKIPIRKKRRGPSQRDYELQTLFSNEPEKEEEIRGPLGDYHGLLKEVKQVYGLELPETTTIRNPFPTIGHFLFQSQGTEVTTCITKLLNNQLFQDYIEKCVRICQEIFNLLDGPTQTTLLDLFSIKLDESIDFESVHINLDKEFEKLDRLKQKKAEDPDFNFIVEFCNEFNIPLEIPTILSEYIFTGKLNKEALASLTEQYKKELDPKVTKFEDFDDALQQTKDSDEKISLKYVEIKSDDTLEEISDLVDMVEKAREDRDCITSSIQDDYTPEIVKNKE
jgi:hypothetical protein